MHAITMPKWGMTMTEGRLVQWLVNVGDSVSPGQEIMEVETEKIASTCEASYSGVLRCRLVEASQVAPVGALLGVVADPKVPDAELDAFIASYASRAGAQRVIAAAAPAARRIALEGGGINVLSLGAANESAAPALLIHGFGGDLDSWLFNQPGLAAGRLVHALDLPAHGGSDLSAGSLSFEILVAAVAATLEALGAERVHLIGHSIGGALAVRLAASSSRVMSVTLLSSAGLGAEIGMSFVDGLLTAERRAQMKSVLEQLLFEPSKVHREMVERQLKFMRTDGVPAALRALAADCFPAGRQRIDVRAELGRLTVPVQVIWGRADRIIPCSHASGLGPAIQVYVLENAGHMPHMEQAKRVDELLAAHLHAADEAGRDR